MDGERRALVIIQYNIEYTKRALGSVQLGGGSIDRMTRVFHFEFTPTHLHTVSGLELLGTNCAVSSLPRCF